MITAADVRYPYHDGDYGDYAGGCVDAPTYYRLLPHAVAYVNSLTGGKAEACPAVCNAVCAVIDVLAEDSAAVKSESNDGVSITYRGPADPLDRRIYRAAAVHLSGTGLLYRGVYG